MTAPINNNNTRHTSLEQKTPIEMLQEEKSAVTTLHHYKAEPSAAAHYKRRPR